MFPFLGGMLSGLLGSGAGSAAASGLGGMAGGAAGNLAGIGEMASAGGLIAPASGKGDPPANPVLNSGGANAGTPQSGSPGGMGQAPAQGQSPLMQPITPVNDPLMSSNSLLNGIGGPLKQFFGMGG